MKKIVKLAVCLTAILFFTSCKDDGKKYLSTATGKPGEVIIVAEDNLWNSEVGEAVRKTFSETDTLLPQPEARFSLIHVSPNRFSNLYQVHRNIIIIDADQNESEDKVSSREDVWAKPQTVIYVKASKAESIIEQVEKKSTQILNIFEKAELERIARNAQQFEGVELREAVEKKYGYTVYFPQDYEMLGDKNEFMWIGLRTTKRTQGIFIYSYPYTSTEQLSLDSLVAKRNAICKEYVLLDKEPQGSAYMITANYRDPVLTTMTMNDAYFARLRGLWEIENDFMGGPFVSYTTVDQKRNRIITFDGFVYAPSRSKRDLLRQIEGIIIAAKPVEAKEAE